KTVSGEVMSVNPAKNELVVKDETGGEVRLLGGKTTKGIREGKALSLADLKTREKGGWETQKSTGSSTAKKIPASSWRLTSRVLFLRETNLRRLTGAGERPGSSHLFIKTSDMPRAWMKSGFGFMISGQEVVQCE